MCEYVRLSGGAHGFHGATKLDAERAANELDGLRSAITYTKERWSGRKIPFSVSYFNRDNEEVLIYHIDLCAMQVFDPPRKVAEKWLSDAVI